MTENSLCISYSHSSERVLHSSTHGSAAGQKHPQTHSHASVQKSPRPFALDPVERDVRNVPSVALMAKRHVSAPIKHYFDSQCGSYVGTEREKEDFEAVTKEMARDV